MREVHLPASDFQAVRHEGRHIIRRCHGAVVDGAESSPEYIDDFEGVSDGVDEIGPVPDCASDCIRSNEAPRLAPDNEAVIDLILSVTNRALGNVRRRRQLAARAAQLSCGV